MDKIVKKINHELFGEVVHDLYWTTKDNFFGQGKTVSLTIDGEEDNLIPKIQEEAYRKFITDINKLTMELCVFSSYKNLYI
ncbi:DUF6985 domain-containing protein [Bacillus mycoides]|uniref:DUF6985 domain-containing protein n=1 Tax=Bacillus mycoides TaxID=1405 RepID=UPI003D20E246